MPLPRVEDLATQRAIERAAEQTPPARSRADNPAAAYDRQAMAANAVLLAIKQRGEYLFTGYAMQCVEGVTNVLNTLALGLEATERVPDGSELPATNTYSAAMEQVTDAAEALVSHKTRKAAE